MSAIAAAASFNPDTISAKRLRPDQNASNAISRTEICNTVAAAAQAHDIPVAFFTSLIWQESGFRAEAVSPVGAQGVAQFMPRVAEAMGLENPFDPLQALPMSARLLRTLFNQFGNFGLAAAAYNAGPARVLNWLNSKKKAQLPKETRDYVLRITGRDADQWRTARASVEFHAPESTRCHVIASRAERADGEFKVVDMANIPLPRRRPGSKPAEPRREPVVAESSLPTSGLRPSVNEVSASAKAAPAGDVVTAEAQIPLPQPRPEQAGAGKAAPVAVAVKARKVRTARRAKPATVARLTVPAPSTKVLQAERPMKIVDLAKSKSVRPARASKTASKTVRVARAD